MKKLFLINLIILASIFLILELSVRIVAPEYIGNIQSETITGEYKYYKTPMGENIIRVPHPDFSIEDIKDKNVFFIFGRSLTHGYSTSYEDIYWVKFSRMLNLISNKELQALAITDFKHGRESSIIDAIEKKLELSGSSIKHVLFNFNFTTIKPTDPNRINDLWKQNIKHHPLQKKFASFRFKYFHYSALMNLLQINIKPMAHKLSGTCTERGIDALGAYSWTVGSKPLRKESETAWKEFEKRIEDIKNITNKIGASFVISLAPVLMDIDLSRRHPKYNTLNLDFSCATIDPRKRLKLLAEKLDIDFIDPTQYLKHSFEARLKENNFIPYYTLADTSHLTPTASGYLAEYITAHYLKKGLAE